MKSADEIERLAKKIRIRTSDAIRERILSDAEAALVSSTKKGEEVLEPSLSIWRTIMKSRITRLAAAAVIVIAVMVGLHYYAGPIGVTSVALGDVLRNVEQARAFIYRMRETRTRLGEKHTFADETERMVYISTEYGMRMDNYQDGRISISTYSLIADKAIITVCHPMKFYSRIERPEDELASLAQMGPKGIVSGFTSENYRELGRKTIDGVAVKGFEVLDPPSFQANFKVDSVTSRLWVDVATGFPVLIEYEALADGGTFKISTVMDQFQWNVELGPEVFEPNIPADYVEQKFDSGDDAITQSAERERASEESVQPDLPDLDELSLLGIDDDEAEVELNYAGMEEIWKAQDEIMGTWPPYLQVREQLYGELRTKLNIDDLSLEELVATAVALREKFWKAGGCLSKTSYPYGYASRVLLESARQEQPEDMTVTDELAETIQSIEVLMTFEQLRARKTRNISFLNALTELRSAQFEQIKRELQEGRTPTWEDFVRVNDLAILLGFAKDYQSAERGAVWLLDGADAGGWTAYMQPLKDMQRCFGQGEPYNYNIQLATRPELSVEIFRYGRRLPSFKGPRERGVTPVHLLHSKPTWHGQ
ncbi:MAG TPA: hypothetical protein VMX13_00380 [Sedimentisphaerales bacterium]|nr:hypothetical protein [Sedimentisphaerales bacterium]